MNATVKPFSCISLFSIFLLLPFCTMAQGLIIPAGAYVVAGNGNIVVKNNWVNDGSFTHNSGTVIFNGATQTLSGSTATTFNNITILTGSTSTITSPGHKVKSVLLSNGILNANGNLTLLSTAAQTAAVDGSGTGEVLGNLIVQRYIASGLGYKYLSSAFQNDTVGDLANDMNLTGSFPSFYRHDESLASTGWVGYTTGSNPLIPLQGYAANLGASTAAKTIDLKGVVNNHAVSRTLYNHNMAYTMGFSLVGNPYPSPIDWDAASGWTKTNIDNAVYYFNASTTDQYSGVYSSYINGVSSDGIAGSTIAALQGFFVHVSNGSFPVTALLATGNSVRILSPAATFFRVYGQDEKPLIRLTAGFADETALVDPVTIYFSDATSGKKFNKELDALKLMNSDNIIPNLFAVTTDVEKVSIRALAPPVDSVAAVALGLITKKAGWILFNAKEIKNIPAGVDIYLTDMETGLSQNLQKEPAYRLLLPQGEYENRFFLEFRRKISAPVTSNGNSSLTCNAYSYGGNLYVNGGLASGEKAKLTVTDMLGQIVCRQDITGNSYQPVNTRFPQGVYVVSCMGPSKQFSKKIFIGSR